MLGFNEGGTCEPAAGGWTPASLGSKLLAWYKAPASGTTFSTLPDQSGNGYDMVTPSGTMGVTTVSGKRAVVFDKSNYVKCDSLVTMPAEMWLAAEIDNTSDFFAGIWTAEVDDGHGNYIDLYVSSNFTGAVGFLKDNVSSNTCPTGEWHVYAAVGGPSDTTGSWTSGSQIGQDRPYTTRRPSGYFTEMVVTSSGLTSGERASLQSYLAATHP